jgi:hypothetical protein
MSKVNTRVNGDTRISKRTRTNTSTPTRAFQKGHAQIRRLRLEVDWGHAESRITIRIALIGFEVFARWPSMAVESKPLALEGLRAFHSQTISNELTGSQARFVRQRHLEKSITISKLNQKNACPLWSSVNERACPLSDV